jgi:hypothetical protein
LYLQALSEDLQDFLVDDRILVTEQTAPLGVAAHHVFDTNILQHASGCGSGIGTTVFVVAVLATKLKR